MSIRRRYIKATNLDLSSQLPLFMIRPLTKKKSGYALRNSKLSSNRCREIFKEREIVKVRVAKSWNNLPSDYMKN